MSWIQTLVETYNNCCENDSIEDSETLCPLSHTSQLVQVELSIDQNGTFRNAKVVLEKEDQKTIIPCTEESVGRSGVKPKNHPLSDKLQYIAGDFTKFGGVVTSGFSDNPSRPFEMFLEQLKEWSESDFSHPMIVAILKYLQRKEVIKDLVTSGILQTDVATGLVISNPADDSDAKMPPIFKALTTGQSPLDVFVRFRVDLPDTVVSGTWESESLRQAWISYYESRQQTVGFCMATGKSQALAEQHPAKLRHGGDKSKLISSNDSSGFTYRGRFTEANQSATVSFESTQKAHSALRWLIARKQAFRSGGQVFVSWAVKGKSIPDPLANTLDLILSLENDEIETQSGDVGQGFSIRLNKAMSGYKANIEDSDDIVVMGLDSATPGRMAITFYRELLGSEFLMRIEHWHLDYSWMQYFGKDYQFIGAPSPRDIAQAAYGSRMDGKLLNTTVERLLPCIIDGAMFPQDLVHSCVHRASNREGAEHWEWEKVLGIACALFKGSQRERKFTMSLEESRKTRDYLFGRLLAVAEKIESLALYYAKENRDTTAARLMQRFADRPFSTWRTIETSLGSYKSRINSKAPALLVAYNSLLDDIHGLFAVGDYVRDDRLSGEYLLGYHSQRQWLKEHKLEKGHWVLKHPEEPDTFENDGEQ